MSDDLDGLLAACADGVLDADGAAALEARLADPAARRRAALWFAQERQLLDLHRGRSRRRRGRWVAAAAAGLLLAAGALAWAAWPRAELGRCDDGTAVRAGDELAAVAPRTLRLPDGSALALDAGAVLAFPGDGPPLLRAGRLEAEVRPQPAGRGFVLATPHSAIEVLGTRFSVAVADGRSAVAVERGRVRVTDRAAGWSRELLPGGACASGPQAPPLVPRDALWRVRDHDEAAPAGWTAPGFDDAGWRGGRGPFGFGAKARAVRSAIDDGAGPGRRRLTAYFRHAFAADGGGLRLRWRVDDGLVVHLNGAELLRDNMPPGPVDGSTPALRVVDDGSHRWHERSMAGVLRRGVNLLAVEVHQGSRGSTDMLLDLEAVAATDP